MKRILTAAIVIISVSLAACSRGAGDFEDRVAKAEAQVGLGNYLAALNVYASIVGDYPRDPRRAGVFLKIADLQSTGLGNDGEAERYLGEAISAEPLSEAARLARERRASIRQRRGDNEGAIEDYSALLKHFAEGAPSKLYRVQVAGVYLSMRDYRQARTELKRIFNDPDVSKEVLEKAIFIAAESYFLEGKSQRASGYYRWLLEEFPESELAAEAKLHLATCYEEMGFLGVAGFITKSAADDYPNRSVIDARLSSLRARGKAPAKVGAAAAEKGLQRKDASLASPGPETNEHPKGEEHGSGTDLGDN